jgi:hypothetical protein
VCLGINCSPGSVQVAPGCYNPITNHFNSSTTTCSGAPDQQSVYVRTTTVGGRTFRKLLAQLFVAAQIDISTSAFSYWYVDASDPLVKYYVTGPFTGTKS